MFMNDSGGTVHFTQVNWYCFTVFFKYNNFFEQQQELVLIYKGYAPKLNNTPHILNTTS